MPVVACTQHSILFSLCSISESRFFPDSTFPESEHAAEKSDTNIYGYGKIMASASFEDPTFHSHTAQLLGR